MEELAGASQGTVTAMGRPTLLLLPLLLGSLASVHGLCDAGEYSNGEGTCTACADSEKPSSGGVWAAHTASDNTECTWGCDAQHFKSGSTCMSSASCGTTCSSGQYRGACCPPPASPAPPPNPACPAPQPLMCTTATWHRQEVTLRDARSACHYVTFRGLVFGVEGVGFRVQRCCDYHAAAYF